MVLKVDVDTCAGTLNGVPALLGLFERHGVTATFLFSVGPDNTGRAIRRIFRKGFLQKVGRTSVLSHYGLKTLMNGVVKPGPHIGRKAGHVMRDAQAAGHEVGIHCYDHVRWQDFVAGKDRNWTRTEMQKARDAFRLALGSEPSTIGAAGWQLNPQVIALEEQMGFRYASDCRGKYPFFPVMGAVESSCMQLPTTLPTLD
jgi:peptidoglycan/xylan/chitin deacetylase (PgdA/CDA1 family)